MIPFPEKTQFAFKSDGLFIDFGAVPAHGVGDGRRVITLPVEGQVGVDGLLRAILPNGDLIEFSGSFTEPGSFSYSEWEWFPGFITHQNLDD